jgi:hypothetical protein
MNPVERTANLYTIVRHRCGVLPHDDDDDDAAADNSNSSINNDRRHRKDGRKEGSQQRRFVTEPSACRVVSGVGSPFGSILCAGCCRGAGVLGGRMM